ncbi:hypothetical protein Gotri_022473 [Gossypium trilobum]|uniref:Uncharacterized protein n=1 Tax=Gossypium trilobum TaxID=34281 RepID=A0A7J9DG41_9ROSI|nr:hypothetical protein [Gossypium trilobum]
MCIEFPLANCCSKSQRISSLSIRSSEPLTAPAPFLNHGRYFGHCVDVVHLLQQLTICNCVLEGVKSLALLHNLHLESAFYVSDASEGWNCVCYTVVSLVKTLPVIFCIRIFFEKP